MGVLRSTGLALVLLAAGMLPALASEKTARKGALHRGSLTVGLFDFSGSSHERPSTSEKPPARAAQQAAFVSDESPGEITGELAAENDQQPDQLAEDLIPSSSDNGASFDPNATRLNESTWYTRVEFFRWNETLDGKSYMNNEGVATTLGWQQRHGQQRYRFDFFGARPDYYTRMDGELFTSVTDYLGLRGEYELLWEPSRLPELSLFAGIGTRYFVRSIPDSYFDGVFIDGYQETWWTFYPYLGYEIRRTMKTSVELYGEVRAGLTAFTREHVTLTDATLFPRPGVTMQSEVGLRGSRLSLACFFELMGWSASPRVLSEAHNHLYWVRQPQSMMGTIGGRVAWSY